MGLLGLLLGLLVCACAGTAALDVATSVPPPPPQSLPLPAPASVSGALPRDDERSVLACVNQTQCIAPILQLNKPLKVYLCQMLEKKGHGRIFHSLIQEGLKLHPKVRLLTAEQIAEADFVVRTFDSAQSSECLQSSLVGKTIVLDDRDQPLSLHEPVKGPHWMYFKRSFAVKVGAKFENFTHIPDAPPVYPLTYSLRESHIHSVFPAQPRSIDIFSPVRPSAAQPAKTRVHDCIIQYSKEHANLTVVTFKKAVTMRQKWNSDLMLPKRGAKIIITTNADRWEGDHRVWDALAAGALLFVDPLFVPTPFPLLHQRHVVFYNPLDQTDLTQKLDHYLRHPQEARRIAEAGYLHAMRYHRSANLVDYILTSAQIKQLAESKKKTVELTDADRGVAQYVFVAQDLLAESRVQAPSMRKCQQPGIYAVGLPNSEVQRLEC